MKIKRTPIKLVKTGLCSFGTHNCSSKIGAGDVDKTSDWSFTADDGNKLLGANGDDWTEYAKWHLGEDTSASANTKERYKYPFGKNGKVYRSALIAIRSRSSQQGDDSIYAAAGHYIDRIDGKAAEVDVEKDLPKIMLKTPSLKQQAWSKFEIKAINEEQRIITGIATTPSPDRVQDVVEPLGAKYDLPLPFLWQHDSDCPVGHVTSAKPTKDGIPVTIQLAMTDEPGQVKDRLDSAWQDLKLGLVRGLSIGFAPKEYSYMSDTGGYHFLEWDWLELSAVTIPCNADCSIQTIKSFDRKARAASRHKSFAFNKTAASGELTTFVGGKDGPELFVPSANNGAKTVKISEQLKALRKAREEKMAALQAIQQKAADENRSKTAEEKDEFDGLKAEIGNLDDEIKDAEEIEALQVVKAAPVAVDPEQEEEGISGAAAGSDSNSRGPTNKGAPRILRSNAAVPGVQTVALRKPLEKGQLFARYVKCVAAARGVISDAVMLAKEHYKDTPDLANVIKLTLSLGSRLPLELAKAAVGEATTTDATNAGPLLQYVQFAGDFIEYLRPKTIIGKFGTPNGAFGTYPSLRPVPFNIHIRGQTSGGSGYWVGQGKPKPLTKVDFEDVYLGFAKAAAIAVLSDELIRFSNPSADMLVRDALSAAIIERLDIDFVDPNKAVSANVSPASITNGVTPVSATGTTAADARVDIGTAIEELIDANIDPTTAVWIMPSRLALNFSLLRNNFGQKEFPEIGVNGGILEGLPVMTSQYVPNDTDGSLMILAAASEIYLSDDGAVTVDASREASLEMSNSPSQDATNGTGAEMVSLFQTNSVGLRAERYINWKKRRAAAVSYISGAVYKG